MILFGWTLLGIEIFLSVLSGLLFWHFWSHSAMQRNVAVRAVIVYGIGCSCCLLLTFFVPL